MNQPNFLKIILLISIVTIILFPLYAVLFQVPSFARLLAEHTTNEAVLTATRLSSLLVAESSDLRRSTLPPKLIGQIKGLQNDAHFLKLKIYAPSGQVIYSTDPRDVGTVNKEAYFREIAASGKGTVKEVRKNAESLERQVMSSDVVETYVPILKGTDVIGVFEIYYDIADEKQKLYRLLYRSYGTLFIMSAILLAAAVISALKAHRSMTLHRKAEEEREELIVDLQGALARVKTLSGLLPVCSSCKKIRDDHGYWQQMEKYLSTHTSADFSHGLCPECVKKLYPDFCKGKE